MSGAGFGTDTNVITMITKEEELALDIMTKAEAAKQILDKILEKANIDMILLISRPDGFWNVILAY